MEFVEIQTQALGCMFLLKIYRILFSFLYSLKLNLTEMNHEDL